MTPSVARNGSRAGLMTGKSGSGAFLLFCVLFLLLVQLAALPGAGAAPDLDEQVVSKDLATTESAASQPQNAEVSASPPQNAQTFAPLSQAAGDRESPLPDTVPVSEEPEDAAPAFAAQVKQVAYWLELERLAAFYEADNGLDPAWRPLLHRLEAEGHEPERLVRLFSGLGPDAYTPAYMGAKISELYGVSGIGINREQAPGPEEPRGYLPPVPDATAGSCLAFMRDNDQLFQDIKARFGVERDVLVALLLVETAFGQNLGRDRALRVLASMAATDSVEMLASRGNQGQAARIARSKLQETLEKRSRWAFNELLNLMDFGALMSDPASLPSSSMGAIGLCQFMPSNIPLFGVDGDQDGVINLFFPADALHSAANYLQAHGWRQARSEEAKRRVLMSYNHDSIYASYVAATARLVDRALKGKVPPGRMLLAAGIVPSARLDPSLRRLKPVPRRARVESLGDYKSLLQ